MVGAQDGDGLSELLHDHLYTNLFVANPVHDGLRFYGEPGRWWLVLFLKSMLFLLVDSFVPAPSVASALLADTVSVRVRSQIVSLGRTRGDGYSCVRHGPSPSKRMSHPQNGRAPPCGRPRNKPIAASAPGGRWGSVVFGWRALRPPRVVFVLGFVSLQ